jgi:hypothetical protein
MKNQSSHANWPYPRYGTFIRSVRAAAAKWFAAHKYRTGPQYAYILAEWEDWPKNIIVPEVSAYIQQAVEEQRIDGKNFPLHKYIHHGLSSQAMLFNLVGPLLVANTLDPLKVLIEKQSLAWPGAGAKAYFEYEDRTVFNETHGQPTSIDMVITSQSGEPLIFIESKFVEHEFGGCSVYASGDCDGRNPSADFELCYLHHIGRRYWSLLKKHGFLEGAMGRDALCMLSEHYQFFRELILALEKGGIFVLLSDDRSPVFRCQGPKGERGLLPLLLSLVPAEIKRSVAQVSVQELVGEIEKTGKHGWIKDFKEKYALA